MARLLIGHANQLNKSTFTDQLALASCLNCICLNTLLWKELVDWRSASWVKVGSLTWHGKSSESGILPLNLQPEAISSPGVCPEKTMSDNICPIAPGVPHQSLSQVCLHFQSQLQSLWLALLHQLRIFLQAVDTALCQEVRWPKKFIKKLHVTQGQPVSSGLWMTSSYSFFKKIQWFAFG